MTSRVGVSGQVRDGLSPSSTYKLSSAAFTKRNLTPAFTGWERGREGETERERERGGKYAKKAAGGRRVNWTAPRTCDLARLQHGLYNYVLNTKY